MPTIFLKAESVNTKTKATARHPDAMASIIEETKEDNLLPRFPPNEMPALFPVQRSIGTRLQGVWVDEMLKGSPGVVEFKLGATRAAAIALQHSSYLHG